ncbi:MAG: transketolase C-terminal domain-containing protein [Alkalispirochaeta sp.]
MSTSREITYAEAIREAMSEEMRKSDDVFLMGEDVGIYGGAFGVSVGMIDEFGEERVRDTPISAAVIVGAAAQHSSSMEAWYTHVPGLKVVIPSTPYDAKGLLKSAIADDNPVVFLEQKLLYRVKGVVPEEEYTIPLSKSDVKREGSDVTVITWGRMVNRCLEVAEELAKEGIELEVVDPRTLMPLDEEPLVASARKTGRVLIVHEAVQTGGYGGEIAARIADSDAFYYLDAPIKRLGRWTFPCPTIPCWRPMWSPPLRRSPPPCEISCNNRRRNRWRHLSSCPRPEWQWKPAR